VPRKVDTPLVTVIIPTFNRAAMVCEALDSVLAQSYRPLEVVVVDDGSTDGTAEAVARWGEEHAGDGFSLRCVRQENLGGNPARNRGIAKATGSFIAFLDSDDRWLPEKLQRQLDVLRRDRCIGGVYCGVRHVNAETGEATEPTDRAYPSGRLLQQLLIKDVTAPTSTYVIRREVFKKVGRFDTNLQARQDWDMWIRLAAEYEIGCVPEPLVEYRHHPGTRTNSDPRKEIYAYGRIMEKYANLRKSQPWSVRRAATGAYFRRMGRVHFHQGISTTKAIQYYLRSLMAWPFDFDTWAALGGVLMPRPVRQTLHKDWNRVFGHTRFAIRSH